jgi:excinuclease ABC subunit A
VATGQPSEIMDNPSSLTGRYLKGALSIPVPAHRRAPNGKALTLLGCAANNLKDLDVRFPLAVLTVVTGVSGSGKSTLVGGISTRAAQGLARSTEQPGKFRAPKAPNTSIK